MTREVRERFRRFAERECRDYSPLYYRLATEVSTDGGVLEFVAGQPDTQPNLLFAAVQFLTGPERLPRSAAELYEFLRERGGEVSTLMQTRRTQTNEVGRCSALLPALPKGPLALFEVGASAGLCLLLDRFYYDYGSAVVGDASSPVRIDCKIVGPVPVPGKLPEILWRRGLDLHPLDVRHDEDAEWLLACVWPDHPERRQRLDAAIALARSCPTSVATGDLIDDLPALVGDAPDDALLVIFHSATLFYLSERRRLEFARNLSDLSRDRHIVWISNEGKGVVADLADRAPADTRNGVVGRVLLRKGRRSDEVLALAHPHGATLTWLRDTHDGANPRSLTPNP